MEKTVLADDIEICRILNGMGIDTT